MARQGEIWRSGDGTLSRVCGTENTASRRASFDTLAYIKRMDARHPMYIQAIQSNNNPTKSF